MNGISVWPAVVEVLTGLARGVALLVVMFVPIWYFERRQGAPASRYLSRDFVHDVAYSLFYRSGIFTMLGAAYLASGMSERLRLVHWSLLSSLPVVLQALCFWILMDLAFYWIHRAQHAVPWLWQLHSVHHTAERMTYVTAFRLHPVETLYHNTIGILPFVILGAPPKLWVPIALFQSFFEAVQHAELTWTYGPLYRVFVSPVFHRIHHSRDRRHFDQNFSKIFSAWDYLFGTASPDRTPPKETGVEGMPSDATLLGQFVGPFTRIARGAPPSALPRWRSDAPTIR